MTDAPRRAMATLRDDRNQVAATVGVALAVFIAVPPAAIHLNAPPHAVWVLALATGALALNAVSRATHAGLLVNERNCWSLSRFQLVGWTWLLLSTFWCLVAFRMKAGTEPLDITVAPDLWLLLGINATSFTGASLIDCSRQQQSGDLREQQRGTSSIRDLFMGTAENTAHVVDMSRVQMWFFTVVTLISYAVGIWKHTAGSDIGNFTLPAISTGMNTLLGISHATYLASKVATSPTPPPSDTAATPTTPSTVTSATVEATTSKLTTVSTQVQVPAASPSGTATVIIAPPGQK